MTYRLLTYPLSVFAAEDAAAASVCSRSASRCCVCFRLATARSARSAQYRSYGVRLACLLCCRRCCRYSSRIVRVCVCVCMWRCADSIRRVRVRCERAECKQRDGGLVAENAWRFKLFRYADLTMYVCVFACVRQIRGCLSAD